LNKLAVINPQKFNFDRERIMAFSNELLEKTGAKVRVSLSKEDIGRIIRREGKNADVIIAVGGDGTIYETLNCINLDKQALAIIPKGTGNGFAMDVDINTFEKAVEVINKGVIREIDLIEAQYTVNERQYKRLVISTAGIGYVESVVSLGARFFKPLKKMCYPIASVITAFRRNDIVINSGIRKGRFSNIMINNTKHAGNFKAFPRASVDDGKIDLLLARNNAFHQIMFNLSLLTGAFEYKRGEMLNPEEAGFVFAKDMTLMLDGEIVKNANNMNFRILKKRLKCFI
jgi:diacylglycerol kinase family enzyme